MSKKLKAAIDQSGVEKIVDFLPYPFLIYEIRKGVTYNLYANRKFLEEIGYTIEEMPTIKEWFLCAYPDKNYREEVIRGWEERLQKARAAGEDSVMMKVLIHTKHLGDVWYEVKSGISEGGMQFVAFVNINEEIAKERELATLNENKNRTLSILSHDLRIPLSNLHSLVQLMLSSNLTAVQFTEMVRNVNRKIFQVMEFVDTTLLWTKSNFESVTIQYQEIELKKIVKEILAIYESSYQNKAINIAVNLDGQRMMTDGQILTILLRNIISNAIKFTPEKGEIAISAQVDPKTATITVKDSGVGMSRDTIQQLQADNYTSSQGTWQEKGLGVGLKLCHQLIRKLNGKLEIESELGKGTQIQLVFKNETLP